MKTCKKSRNRKKRRCLNWHRDCAYGGELWRKRRVPCWMCWCKMLKGCPLSHVWQMIWTRAPHRAEASYVEVNCRRMGEEDPRSHPRLDWPMDDDAPKLSKGEEESLQSGRPGERSTQLVLWCPNSLAVTLFHVLAFGRSSSLTSVALPSALS